jgi:hypothetical protein
MNGMPEKPQPPRTITKILSPNDTGESGSHQAGMLIPKHPDILAYFPALDDGTKNPRVHLQFKDNLGGVWTFAFIYYNNAFFGGTRNEYRLTRMTEFFRANHLSAGDELILSTDPDGEKAVSFRRAADEPLVVNGMLILRDDWKIIPIALRRSS